ncbi:hypothetical protein GPK63_01270 [Faecalibacterium prausnitzii]|uniref:hypothetical protein n=1 Tax=Faecalibacterium prausnitzii TaxID=853 RepID=UPI001C01C52D|nr:hypothetical protein [Faecalibacterium prausnitzii]MBT9711429.1 hypothetical protein [Faecalibacterium prausnitzii]DAI72071.1 MAG TPA: type I neck protein [Caudoviricetes sp.]
MTTPKKASGRLKIAVDDTVKKVNREAASRGTRAVNAIRNAELEVLRGKRSGRVYRKPHTKSHYTASAPGEPPARRTGNLRLNWNGTVESSSTGSGLRVTAVLESQERYSTYLENGTRRMAPRPFKQPISEKAMPEIERIYHEKYD